MGPFSFLLTYTYTQMEKLISTIGKRSFYWFCFAFACFLFAIAHFALATEPTPQERAAAELPDVLREIERTQEYADRNAAAKVRREAISQCISSGSCDSF
jgi:hypothetical protein